MPYRNSQDFKQSVPNKVIDSLVHGLPLLTSLEGEVKSIIMKNNVGFYYNDVSSLLGHCNFIVNNQDKLVNMRKNASDCYLKYFDFEDTYNKICSVLEALGNKNER